MPGKDKSGSNKSQPLEGLSEEAIREMEIAIDDAWNNSDPVIREHQRTLFPAGKPSPSEFIRVMTDRVKKGL